MYKQPLTLIKTIHGNGQILDDMDDMDDHESVGIIWNTTKSWGSKGGIYGSLQKKKEYIVCVPGRNKESTYKLGIVKSQSKSKYQRNSGGYFVGEVPLNFDRFS